MRRRAPEPVAETVPNLAPMVDVIMVLLVFFLLTAAVNRVEGVLQTQLDPSSGPSQGAAVQINPLIRIALEDVEGGKGANIYLMEQPVAGNSFEALYEKLSERRRAGADVENPIVIGAEQTVRWKYVIHAMDAAVHAGFKNVQYAVSMTPGSVSRSAQ